MASDILVPSLGESVTEAIVSRWLKQPGEAVAMDEALVELETDKVTLEVNAPIAGSLGEILVPEGETVEVGALLGRVGEGGGAVAAAPAPAPAAPAPAPAAPAPAPVAAPPAQASGKSVEVKVPTLGESVTEAIVSRWIKQEGDAVGEDEPIVELETDKVTLEVNAPTAGVLEAHKAAEGDTVEVDALLAVIAAGAVAASTPAAAAALAPAAAPATAPAPAPVAAGANGGLDPASVSRSTNGKIGQADLLAYLGVAAATPVMPLSPAVQRLVSENDLDPGRIPATGKEGRLTKEDVLKVIEDPSLLIPLAPPPVPTPPPAPSAPLPATAPATEAPRQERVRMTRLRQTIAKRLKEAQNTAAMLTTFNEADMSAVMALRARYKESFEKAHGIKLGFMSFFAKAAVAALKAVPAANAQLDGDEIVYNHDVHIGMAVSAPAGLMVPVIRDCGAKSFAEIEASLVELAKRARDGKLGLEEMQGGTFTITNGGIFGSLLSTPILNPPQSAILGLHKIEERAVVIKGEVAVRPMMYLAMSYDHRLIDGREAVTTLVKIKEAIEAPEKLLLGL